MPLKDSIIAGSLAGGLGYLGTLPLDFFKQHLQSNSHVSFDWFKQQGWRVFFKGGVLGSVAIVPQMIIKFSSNDYLNHRHRNSPFTNGFIAGYLDGSFLGPVLAIQSIQQMNPLLGYSDVSNIIRKTPNISSLMMPMAGRNAIYTSILLGGYQKFRETNFYSPTFLNDILIGSALNIPATLLCSPCDVIRAKQIQNLMLNKDIRLGKVISQIYCDKGLLGFYQGYSSLYVNFALRFPLTLALFQLFIKNF
jgi:hypothetical protein